MTQDARNLRAQGHHVISLSVGEPDFDTPVHIREAAKTALDEGHTRYTPVSGTKELREAISRKFKRENNLEYSADQIVVSNGAKQSIANLALALLNPGDEAILFAPYWVSYSAIVGLAGATPVELKASIKDDFKVTPEQLQKAITDRTRMVIFSSPCNPTGSVYTREELESLADVICQHKQITIVSDEIYEHINFQGSHCSMGTIEAVREQTVTVNGFSKGFAMTGWRLGYLGGPSDIAKACSKIQGQFTSGANAFGQRAAIKALEADLAPTREMAAAFLQRRDMMIGLLNEIDGLEVNIPQGAFYIFPDVSAFFGRSSGDKVIENSDHLATYLLHEAHVAVVAGSAFGSPECMRISYAASEEELREAVRRIGLALNNLH
ncbi:MAG: pyridoxal phosphate-dependent aminotransferase [Saprospiraceae bacterium]|nr:pyridoxal phosphate-dependent aminotransferase [Saprospiraceae bacterium]